MRQAKVYFENQLAGLLTENENGFIFLYHSDYLKNKDSEPISLTMPLQKEAYQDKVLFPFFDGLIPEGWLLEIAEQSWKINHRDRMSLLLACCKDCIGAVRQPLPVRNQNYH
ncbi:MAG: HipA N-terminal domain-containing protein [Candidatus Symbiothrix sp.]|jgi:serine/threonine-protein kinase HipA|nr:HipA N-terminal domain-containing protein [Candidatus Symbiothrix sp.]